MGFRIKQPDSAFSLDRIHHRIKDEAHLALVRQLPSMISGEFGCDPAHVNFAVPSIGKSHRGKSQRADDCFVLPLTRALHRSQHKTGLEQDWWARHGIDNPSEIALRLYSYSKQKLSEAERISICSEFIETINRRAF